MKIPLLDLKRQYKSIETEIKSAIEEVLTSQHFILGPNVEELERQIANYVNAKYAVGVSSGTDALLISLIAADIGPGDEVITTPYTFFATAGSISRVGATPVFVDIIPNNFCIDPNLIESKITNKTKAIIPVHLYGYCCKMDQIKQIADKHNLIIIEDAAQAIGAYYYHDGVKYTMGSCGDFGCFSFFPSKNLGAYGDGGMVVTNDKDKYEKLKILRAHGSKPKYYHNMIGGNFRLDAIQAAILLVKLRYLKMWSDMRRNNAAFYINYFQETIRFAQNYIFPTSHHNDKEYCIYNQFVITCPERDKLRQYLTSKDIGTEIYYPVPLHMQNCFNYLGYEPDDLPISKKASETSVALPIYPELSNDELGEVLSVMDRFVRK
jgi:dTDP-4-amino-4,6-dideoxygalactose transaminase